MASKLGDIRFEGFSNAQLADQVNKLKEGQGAAALHPVIDALHSIAQDLDATNQILTTQLGKIGIDWQSVAGQGGHQVLTSTVNYGDQSQYHIDTANSGLTTQSDSYAVAKSAPAPSSDTNKTFVDNAAGFFGYQTDHAKDVEQAQADRDQAIQQLNGYQQNSADAIASTTPMSAPPTIGLTAQPVQGTSIGQVGYSGTAGGYAGPGGGGYGGGGYSQVGGPGGGGYAAPGAVPGGGAGGVPGPGGVSGVGPGMGRLPSAMPPAAAAASGLLAEEVGLGAALAGGAGAVAAGARSGNPSTIVRGGGTSGAPGEKANTPSKASATAGAIDEEQAAQARAAERIAPGKPGASMMQPGAAGGRGKKEEDSEHDRKYTVEEDLFGEQRMVAPTVLGEDPDA
ncbi:hypothetical protein [Kutzneria sp. NPDC052558]|uniref:hypothetical protein n=1 Tax=Kutzneria sp. NPDC052558 TaxID=3364121 RepID=UPI0037CC728A